LTQDHVYLSPPCLAHNYSNYTWATWVKCEFITNLVSILLMWCCYNPYHSMCLYTMLINEPFELCSQCQSFISNPIPT
jgi:hypothetical protein